MLDEERLIQNLPLGRSSLWKEGALRFYSVSDLQKAATNELDVFIITLSSRTHSSVSHCPVSAAYAPPPTTHTRIHTQKHTASHIPITNCFVPRTDCFNFKIAYLFY